MDGEEESGEASPGRAAWVVVLAESGIPTTVELFPTQQRADRYAGRLRMGANLEDDEVAVFRRMLPIRAKRDS